MFPKFLNCFFRRKAKKTIKKIPRRQAKTINHLPVKNTYRIEDRTTDYLFYLDILNKNEPKKDVYLNTDHLSINHNEHKNE